MTDAPAETPQVRRFSEVSAVERVGEGRYAATIDPEWSIMGNPNGGYLVAMMARAAADASDHEHLIASSAHFLRSPQAGPVEIEVEPLRAGRSTGQSRVRLRRDDQVYVESLVTIGPVDPDVADFWAAGVPPASATAFDDCHRLVPPDRSVAIMEQVDLRLEERSLGFAFGEPAGVGELWGWIALPHDEAFDPVSLHFALDSFPPATFDIEMAGWVPTLELTTYVRGVPAPGPVRVLQKAQLIRDHRVDELCWVWDSTGRLVAHGSQLAMFRRH